MHPSDHLFELIHSLKKEEKRQFKLYVKKYSKSSNFLLLFDLIAKMKRYDEAALKKELAGKHFTERLSVAKEYLYSLILRSLRDQEPETPSSKVLKAIEDISFLLDRRLYAQAKKKIGKAKQIAESYDLFGERSILLDQEAYLPGLSREQAFTDQQKVVEDINENFELGEFAEAMRRFRETKGSIRTSEDSDELQKIVAACPNRSAEELHTFGAKLRYHVGWLRYYEIIHDTDQAHVYVRNIIELYDAYPQFIRTEQLGYITNVMRYCIHGLRSGNAKTYKPYIEKLRAIDIRKQIMPYYEMLLFHFEIHEATKFRDWKKIDALHSGLAALLERNGAEANSFGKDIRIDYYLYFAKAFFLQKKFEQALDDINALLALPTLKSSQQSENNARILQLIIHYELGNLVYLPYLIRSTYRALLRRERLYEFESTLLQYLGSLAKIKKQADILPSFEKLLTKIKSLSSKTHEGEFPWRDFYIEWLEEKKKTSVIS